MSYALSRVEKEGTPISCAATESEAAYGRASRFGRRVRPTNGRLTGGTTRSHRIRRKEQPWHVTIRMTAAAGNRRARILAILTASITSRAAKGANGTSRASTAAMRNAGPATTRDGSTTIVRIATSSAADIARTTIATGSRTSAAITGARNAATTGDRATDNPATTDRENATSGATTATTGVARP